MATHNRVLPYYVPPTLIVRQAATALGFRLATGWKFEDRWLYSLHRLLRVAAGAKFAGCFGYGPHPVLEVTGRCNLKCMHCEVRGGEYNIDPSTDRIFRMIDSLATVPEFRMLVLTGGEPLLRRDIEDIVNYARNVGFEVTIATNGTLISRKLAEKLASLEITGVAISLDFIEPWLHDKFRGVDGAWHHAIEGIRNAAKAGLYIQVNITLSKLNMAELPYLLRLADDLGSHVVLLYQFQPYGRGEAQKDISLSSNEFLNVIIKVSEFQKNLKTLVVPVGLPEYFMYLIIKKPLIKRFFSGCIAGRGMFYVKWYGDAWPCAFLQTSVGNILKMPALKIWRNNKFLIKLRDRNNLKERCKSCEFKNVCGGCRSRAYRLCGDPFAGDPICIFNRV